MVINYSLGYIVVELSSTLARLKFNSIRWNQFCRLIYAAIFVLAASLIFTSTSLSFAAVKTNRIQVNKTRTLLYTFWSNLQILLQKFRILSSCFSPHYKKLRILFPSPTSGESDMLPLVTDSRLNSSSIVLIIFTKRYILIIAINYLLKYSINSAIRNWFAKRLTSIQSSMPEPERVSCR